MQYIFMHFEFFFIGLETISELAVIIYPPNDFNHCIAMIMHFYSA